MYLHKKIILLLILAIVGTFSCLYGYQSIPRIIRMQITSKIANQIEFDRFLADYSEYQMHLINLCLGHDAPSSFCTKQYFIFNSYLISVDEMRELLLNDERVRFQWIGGLSNRFRTLLIGLHDWNDLIEFIECYSQYGFRGSTVINHTTTRTAFTFQLDKISPSDLFTMIKSNPMVRSIRYSEGWVAGVFLARIDYDCESEVDDIIKDYAHFGDVQWSSIAILPYDGNVFIRFDHIKYDEFRFLDELRNDERIQGVVFHDDTYRWCYPNIVVSQADETVIPMTRITAFPNPAMNSDVNIQVLTKDTQIASSRLNAEMSIYNIRGQRVFVSNDFQLKDGELSFVWNNRDINNQQVASGVYFYRINVNDKIHTGRLLIIK